MQARVLVILFIFAIFLSVLYLINNPSNPTIKFGGNKNRVLIYQKGRIVQRGSLNLGPDAEALDRLIASKKGDWSISFTHYAPKILVVSERFSINVHEDFAVVNYLSNNQQWHQLITSLSKKDFEKISSVVTASLNVEQK